MQSQAQPTRKVPIPTHEITDPHCDKAFKIDEAGYADILKQVRDGDFEKQFHERLELAEREKLDAGEVARKLAVTEALGTVIKERDQLANELEQTRNCSQAGGQRNEAATGRYCGREPGRGGGRPRSSPSSKKCTGRPGTSTRIENTQPESG